MTSLHLRDRVSAAVMKIRDALNGVRPIRIGLTRMPPVKAVEQPAAPLAMTNQWSPMAYKIIALNIARTTWGGGHAGKPPPPLTGG